MAQNEYKVEGRSFRTAAEYKLALADKATMDRLRKATTGFDAEKLEQIKDAVHNGKIKFYTLLGQDFEEELGEQIRQKKMEKSDEAARKELKRQDKRRRRLILLCSAVAVACLGYFGVYGYYLDRTEDTYKQMSNLKEKEPVMQNAGQDPPVIHYTSDEDREIPEILDEYKNLLIKNKKLIGWVKIDDTNIDYPVMQTSDNEYYLDHNINQEYDKNGSIFMDKDCDVLKPSTNLILYGHHMQSGRMFGSLGKYEKESYFEKHRYINFDTIYEKGVYEVMYEISLVPINLFS